MRFELLCFEYLFYFVTSFSFIIKWNILFMQVVKLEKRIFNLFFPIDCDFDMLIHSYYRSQKE